MSLFRHTNIQLVKACVDRWRGLKENYILMIRFVIKYIIAILLESKLLDNKEQSRLEMHYDFDPEEIMKEVESYFTNEMSQPTAPSERLR